MTLLLCDGNNLMHRSLRGAPPLRRREDDREVGAALAFVASLHWLLYRYRVSAAAVVFDGPGRGFRRLMHDGYKGGRERVEWTDDQRWQMAAMRVAARVTGARVYDSAPLEADDVIATLAARARTNVVVASDDKDLQYLTRIPRLVVHRFRDVSRADATIGPREARARWGVAPSDIPCVQSLMGDAVDGVVGLRGVGKQRAASLVNEYGSVEAALMRAPEWGGSRWMEHAGRACDARHMRDAVRMIENASFVPDPGTLHDQWPMKIASVLAALGSKKVLAEVCSVHLISRARVHPLASLAVETQRSGVDALPRGLFG